MTEPFLNHFGMFTARQQHRRAAVPQIVQAHFREIRGLQDRLEVSAADVLAIHKSASLVREDQVLVLVRGAELEPPFNLRTAVTLKGF